MMLDNNWYGHRRILAEYCNIKDNPSFSSIQHGWSPYYNLGNFGKKKNNFFPYLCWSKKVELNCRKKGMSNIYAIGSPFLYLCKILNKNIEKIKSEGTILFPPHSTPILSDNTTDHLKLIKKVESECSPPYTVCFYYSDFIHDNTYLYKKNNWRVVTCGSRGNNNMLYNLYRELNIHSTMVSCDISTVNFYAMYLKKKTKILRQENNSAFSRRSYDNLKKIDNANFNKKKYEEMLQIQENFENQLFLKYPSIVNNYLDQENGFNLSKEELGFNDLKIPEDLIKLLGWSSLSKKLISKVMYKYFNYRYGSKIRTGETERFAF